MFSLQDAHAGDLESDTAFTRYHGRNQVTDRYHAPVAPEIAAHGYKWRHENYAHEENWGEMRDRPFGEDGRNANRNY